MSTGAATPGAYSRNNKRGLRVEFAFTALGRAGRTGWRARLAMWRACPLHGRFQKLHVFCPYSCCGVFLRASWVVAVFPLRGLPWEGILENNGDSFPNTCSCFCPDVSKSAPGGKHLNGSDPKLHVLGKVGISPNTCISAIPNFQKMCRFGPETCRFLPPRHPLGAGRSKSYVFRATPCTFWGKSRIHVSHAKSNSNLRNKTRQKSKKTA